MSDTQQHIAETLAAHPYVLYMKGTPSFPQCGFSGQVVSVLNQYDVDVHAINVLADQDIREGIKVYGQWPTIPQLYVKGELIGGCDIINALHEQGELAAALGV